MDVYCPEDSISTLILSSPSRRNFQIKTHSKQRLWYYLPSTVVINLQKFFKTARFKLPRSLRNFPTYGSKGSDSRVSHCNLDQRLGSWGLEALSKACSSSESASILSKFRCSVDAVAHVYVPSWAMVLEILDEAPCWWNSNLPHIFHFISNLIKDIVKITYFKNTLTVMQCVVLSRNSSWSNRAWTFSCWMWDWTRLH